MDVMITAYEGYKFNLSNFGVGIKRGKGMAPMIWFPSGRSGSKKSE
jgi:hypothetical protein